MKELKLNNSNIPAIVDDIHYEHLAQFKWHKGGGEHVSISRYFRLNAKTIYVSLPNEIMKTRGLLYDHMDRNPFNNQQYNIRVCSQSQNACNRKLKRKGRYTGVRTYPTTGKFYARIQYEDRSINLGKFDTELEAAIAYDDAALILHGEFAILNCPIYGA